MRSRKQLLVAALFLPVLTGLTACGELQQAQDGVQQAKDGFDQAQQGLDNASACAQAANIANFTPNFTDPEQAKADSQAKADEIAQLAEQTADQTLKQNLLDVQASIERVAGGEVTLQNSLDWTQAHIDKTSNVATTCGNMVN